MDDLRRVRTTHDLLIIGQGIAGTVLAERAQERGLRVHMYDAHRGGASSRVSAGVVNPVVLRRDVLAWRAAELMPLARSFYTALEQRLGARLWHGTGLVKIFPTANEVDQWARAMQHTETSAFVARQELDPLREIPLRVPLGYGHIPSAAWVDVGSMLTALRSHWQRDGALSEADVTAQDIRWIDGGVSVDGRTAPWLVRCEGSFAEVPGLVPVKGETLTVRLKDVRLPCIVQRGVFVLPMGGEVHRVGATFSWQNVREGPTEAGRAWLLERLGRLIDAEVEVLEHRAGVRPASRDRRPLLGVLRAHEAVFNGLGSRGVMLAPWCAEHLLQHLFGGAALDPEVDVARFSEL